MRILHLDSATTWRGGQRQLQLLVQHGAAEHHVACPPASALAQALAGDDVVVHPWSCATPGRGVRSLRRLVGALRPDVVAAHTPHAHQKLWLAGLSSRAIVHRRVDFVPSRAAIRRLASARGVVAVSEAVADVLVGRGLLRQHIRVVHDGVELVARPRVPQGRVGALGALVAHKGHRTLVDAACRLELPVHIAGEGALRGALEAQIRGSGAPVVLRGQLSDPLAFLASLDVFVHPSHEEGLGQAVIEAMAVGVPVVASAAGGLSEIVQHERTGLLVPPNDPIALAAAIERMCSDRALQERCVEAAREKVRGSFSASVMATRTLAAYDAVLGELL